MPLPSLELDLAPTRHVRLRRWNLTATKEAWRANAHSAVELALVRQGSVAYRIGSQQLIAHPGMMIMVPADVEHAGAIERNMRATSLHLSLDMIAEIACAMERKIPADAVLLRDSKRLAILIDLLESEATATDPGALLAADAYVEAIAVELLRAHCDHTRIVHRTKDPRILAALHKIETDYAEPLTVDALARVAHMSRFHFSRAFHTEIGESPYRYLLDTRVARAAERLRSGRTSVTDAALSVGFHDLGRFSRAFRNKMGVSPGEYASSGRRAQGCAAVAS